MPGRMSVFVVELSTASNKTLGKESRGLGKQCCYPDGCKYNSWRHKCEGLSAGVGVAVGSGVTAKREIPSVKHHNPRHDDEQPECDAATPPKQTPTCRACSQDAR